MNAPQTPRGRPDEEFERDPHGMRDLLANLPDPGPMPEHVSARIEAALRVEQKARTSDGAAHENVTPLVARNDRAEQNDRAAGSSSTSADTARPSRTQRWLRPVAGLGAAAAIGIGALAGVNALNGDKDAPPAAAPSTQQPGESAPDGGSITDRISIQRSGTDYTAGGLATQTASMKNGGTQTSRGSGDSGDSADEGDGGTAASLLQCIQKLGDEVADAPDHISADLGRYEGKPAIILVITKGSKNTAYVMNRDCGSDDAKIAGPTAIA